MVALLRLMLEQWLFVVTVEQPSQEVALAAKMRT
jgi:hypothetical protein